MRLVKGVGSETAGACWMSALHFYTRKDRTWSDRAPWACVSPTVRTLCVTLNDLLPDGEREAVIGPHLFTPLGTNTGPKDESARAFLCADRAVRVFALSTLRTEGLVKTAQMLEAVPKIVDVGTANVAYAAARAAARAAAAYSVLADDAATNAAAAAAYSILADDAATNAAAAAYSVRAARAASWLAAAHAAAANAAAARAAAAPVADDAAHAAAANAAANAAASLLDLILACCAVGRREELVAPVCTKRDVLAMLERPARAGKGA